MVRFLILPLLAFIQLASGGAAILSTEATGTIDVTFPVSPYYQAYAASGGNPRPATGRLLMFLPPGFDPHRSWPILIVNSTTDGGRTSPMDAPWYRAPATAEGWIVLATDAAIRPRSDTTAWRVALLSAGLEVLHHDWPGSQNWPVVLAGVSGGAKRSEWVAVILSQMHSLRIRGLFLSGINEDRMAEALQSYPVTAEFRRLPIWISGGSNDPVATPEKTRDVQGSLVHLGFTNVRFSPFYGGHELDRSDLRRALKWFHQMMERSQGGSGNSD